MQRLAMRIILVLVLTGAIAKADVIDLAADNARSTNGTFAGGSGAQGVINDPFAYNPATPTSPAPGQSIGGSGTDYFHGAGGTVPAVIALTFEDGVHDNLFLDLYGRDGFVSRDDNFTIEFYNGSWDAADRTQQITGFSILPNGPPYYSRATAAPGTRADRVLLSSPDEFFTIMELRANGTPVPEPSTALLLAGATAAAALLRTRRRAN